MRSATTGFFSTFASTKSLMRHRSSQRLKNVAASLYGPGPCDTVKAVVGDPALSRSRLVQLKPVFELLRADERALQPDQARALPPEQVTPSKQAGRVGGLQDQDR